ncbi:activin receptor type-2A-like [Babylonia areolata]|uniref:activin receptor type-2A-like n=1 Tax=Babylonia areolata TaxID=304850 RepID=UPI003FD1EC12
MTQIRGLRNGLFLLMIHVHLSTFCSGSFSEQDLSSAARTRDLTEPEFIGTKQCEKYDKVCNPVTKECKGVTAKETCETPAGSGSRSLCYASWQNNSDGFQFVMKGCWMNEVKCYGERHCRNQRPPVRDIYFCCCEGDMCNSNIMFQNMVFSTSPRDDLTTPLTPVRKDGDSQVKKVVLYSLVPICVGAVIIVALFFMWKRHRQHMYSGHQQLPTVEPGYVVTPSQSSFNLDKVELLELRARGRFGCVWKAQLLNEFVAVKIFPLQDKQSWLCEQEIYNLPQMSHDNVLRFIASEKRGEKLSVGIELWLLTEFHENGSLNDYLKSHIISWPQLCKIAESMARGLAFLHDEIPATQLMGTKPAVAHRDFKSKNVLLKSDLSACVADFGLALKFEPGKEPGETHGLVGTRRYMAPEVLEGAICFNRDAFLRIDMYACALVLWELMTRCNAAEGPVGEYQLPFESVEEIGQHPTMETMQDYVVTRKLRPPIYEHWKLHAGMASLVCTVEECWDQDAEARLSAGCVQERIAALTRALSAGPTEDTPAPPRLPTSVSPPPPPSVQVVVPPMSSDSAVSSSTSSDIPPKDVSSC